MPRSGRGTAHPDRGEGSAPKMGRQALQKARARPLELSRDAAEVASPLPAQGRKTVQSTFDRGRRSEARRAGGTYLERDAIFASSAAIERRPRYRARMSRFDWDRLRRVRPLDGADVRVDPDGGHLWEREGGAPGSVFGRRLRKGVILRRRRASDVAASSSPSVVAPPDVTSAIHEGTKPDGGASKEVRVRAARCLRCGARVSPRKLLRHARRCPARVDVNPKESCR